MSHPIKARVYEILESSNPEDLLSKVDDWLVSVLVILDVSAFVLGTSDYIASHFKLFVDEIEVFSVSCFTLLYILQIWSCVVDPKYSDPFWGRLRYAMTPLALVDAMAVLPFYLILIFPHVALIRFSDAFRLLRLLKLIRYSQGLQTIIGAVLNKKNELLMTLFAVFILLIFGSSFMFFAEHQQQPEAFPSIPAAMWWGVVTLTTVGYGDIYPVTAIGKLFGAILASLGIGLFALPAGIVAAGFFEQVQNKKEREIADRTKNLGEWTPEERAAIAAHIERSSEVMKLCIEMAKSKLGESVDNEETVRDLALFLYRETAQKFQR